MLLRFWKASLGPTQAGRRGCWHLYPPQPGLAGLTSDYGWQFFRFSAAGSKPQSAAAACRAIYQRRTMAANPPQYFARPFTARPRFAARGRGRAAADCARLLYSLFCGNLKPGSLQHTTLPHSLCRVCPFIDVTTWSQQAPWESGMFSTHVLVFIFSSFIHRFDNDNIKPLLPLWKFVCWPETKIDISISIATFLDIRSIS